LYLLLRHSITRDLKNSNIIIDSNDHISITDQIRHSLGGSNKRLPANRLSKRDFQKFIINILWSGLYDMTISILFPFIWDYNKEPFFVKPFNLSFQKGRNRRISKNDVTYIKFIIKGWEWMVKEDTSSLVFGIRLACIWRKSDKYGVFERNRGQTDKAKFFWSVSDRWAEFINLKS